MKIFLVFIFILFQNSFAFLDSNDVYPCKDFENKNHETAILNKIQLFKLDAIIFVSVGSISWILALFVVLTFIKYPPLRKSPGDIIFAISLCELTLCTHWIISAIQRFLYPDEPPANKGDFCQTNAYFSFTAGTLEFTYNCFFCIFIYLKIKNKFRPTKIPVLLVHAIILSFGIGIMLCMVLLGNIGKSILGTCSIKCTSKFPMFGPLLVLVYCFCAVGTIVYFKKHLPSNSEANQIEKNFMDFYIKYTRSCLIIWSIQCVCYFIVVLNCGYIQSPSLLIFYSMTNSVKLASPFVLCLMRLRDPFLRFTIRKHYNSYKRRFLEKDISKRTSSILSGGYMLEQVTDNIKKVIASLMTAGAGFSILYQDKGEIMYDPSSGTYESQFTIAVDDDFLKSNLTNLPFAEREGFCGKLIYHSPDIFKEIQFGENPHINFAKSLDPYQNRENIAKASGADGGRGGELFVFSYDNKLILKTMTTSEFVMFSSILPKYREHLDKYPFSLLTRVFGLFTLEKADSKEKIHFFLMKNLIGVSSSKILRKYDMKGSTVDREVLKKEPSALNERKTLKDSDFLKVERKLYVSSLVSGWLEQSAKLDSEFLRDQGLIDYSIFVVVVKIMDSEQSLLDSSFLEKTNEPNTYYKIGIIDFLQLFNLSKKLEKGIKQFQHLDLNRDVSSQDPEKYSSRFFKFVSRILNEEYSGDNSPKGSMKKSFSRFSIENIIRVSSTSEK